MINHNKIILQTQKIASEIVLEDIDNFGSTHKINIEVKIDKSNTYNSLEWLVPPAVLILLTNSFFDAFFKEAGKDAYASFKVLVKNIIEKIKNKKLVYYNSSGKEVPMSPFGLSIEMDKFDKEIRLLFPANEFNKSEDIDFFIERSFKFLRENSADLDNSIIRFVEDQNNFPDNLSKTIYMSFNKETGQWDCLNLREEMKKKREDQQLS